MAQSGRGNFYLSATKTRLHHQTCLRDIPPIVTESLRGRCGLARHLGASLSNWPFCKLCVSRTAYGPQPYSPLLHTLAPTGNKLPAVPDQAQWHASVLGTASSHWCSLIASTLVGMCTIQPAYLTHIGRRKNYGQSTFHPCTCCK